MLTAAHCVRNQYGQPRDLVAIVAGEHDLNSERDCMSNPVFCNPPPVKVSIDEIFSHPEYNRRTFANDIAVIRVREEIQYDIHIQPICLNFDPYLEVDESRTLILAGWGRTKEQRGTMDLLAARLRMVKADDCQEFYPTQINITDQHICAIGWGIHNSCR